MSARRRNHKTTKKLEPRTSELGHKAAAKPSPIVSKRHKWVFRIAFAILAPLAFFLLLEGGLRLGGYGYPTTFFLGPDTEGIYSSNPQFGWRFFPSAIARQPWPNFLAAKPAGAVRIFIFGSSAAAGVPNPSFSFGRILEAMLKARYPGTKFEVINTAMTAINSHVARQIAFDCAGQDPDLFIVYTGNNEIVGPYGPGTVFQRWSPNSNLIRANIWLKATRTGQLIGNVLRYFQSKNDAFTAWRGMEMFLGNQIAADDPRLEAVYANLRQNLLDMCDIAKRAKAGVILSTIAVNLKDCPPFASQHRADLVAEELTQWKTLYEAGVKLEGESQWSEALAKYAVAAKIDNKYAELAFRQGRCSFAENRFLEAKERFVSSRDLDVLRFRADSKINETIREAAVARESAGVRIFDAENELSAEKSAVGGIAGKESFYEHVHFTFDGNYRVARGLLAEVEAVLPQLAASKTGPVLSKEQCAESLAFTPWNEYRMASQILEMVARPPFTNQLDHAAFLASIRELTKSLEKTATSPEALRRAIESYEAALKKSPDDWELHHLFGKLAMAAGEPEIAAENLQIILKKTPWEPTAHIDYGNAIQKCGRMDEAIAQFEQALEIAPNNIDALNNLGNALCNRGRTAEAIKDFQKALESDPQFPMTYYNLANALDNRGQTDEAIANFQKAISIDPDFALAYNSLGYILNRCGRFEEALTQYQKAVEIDPNFALAHNNLGNAYGRRGMVDKSLFHFQKALEIDPRSATTHFNLGNALNNCGEFEGAIAHFQKAVEIDPQFALGHNNLGLVLAGRGRLDEAIVHFRLALKFKPDYQEARGNLEKALASREGGSAKARP